MVQALVHAFSDAQRPPPRVGIPWMTAEEAALAADLVWMHKDEWYINMGVPQLPEGLT